MLDILGNVFGRSKKQTNSSSNVNNNGQNGEPSDGFVVVGQAVDTIEEQSLYPRMTSTSTILTQEMIVNSGQSSNAAITVQTLRTSVQTYSTPIDNIPFTAQLGSGSDLVDNNSMSINRCFETIDRIQQYLSTASQSEYNFHLENNILSESLLS